jgi:23S rRNA (pseudouridine1915-N3)-methyltransferase
MNKITIIAVGALKNKALETLAVDYKKRIKAFARLELIEIADSPFRGGDIKRAKDKEKKHLEKVLHSYRKEQIYLLSEHGQLFNSLSFAKFLNEQDARDLVLVIAGPLGWDEVWAKRYKMISLSALTFTHELARLILLEQIYRGLSINMGKKYHY